MSMGLYRSNLNYYYSHN